MPKKIVSIRNAGSIAAYCPPDLCKALGHLPVSVSSPAPVPFPLSRRPQCAACLRPLRACLCHCVHSVLSQVQLLVLQHPEEAGHAKNTARLLHLCVQGSQLEVGEVFDPAALQSWLHSPGMAHRPSTNASVHTVLLYPQTPPDPKLPVLPPPPLPTDWLTAPRTLRLVLIDGTWRKSRKMLYLNPLLQRLPRLALHNVPAGRYAIRKAHAPDQLSSFEAAALALAQLQGWTQDSSAWQQLMDSFDAAMRHHQSLQWTGQTQGFNTDTPR